LRHLPPFPAFSAAVQNRNDIALQHFSQQTFREQRSPYNSAMYIVAIAWIYVTLLMALTETNVTAGILTFGLYGLAPLALLLWLTGGPARRRRSNRSADRSDGPHDAA
jgi:hypothetical protein